ncbi:type II secretion system protein J [Metabacillus herbersteinensis]|uniref:Type II secretion system protein J n=1 Tax=Metabacillus herbersteinensis TaxID=283816 RepID=A0ABV6G920_9BACI
MQKLDQRQMGITLIELLAVLAIMSFLLILVGSMLINGLSYSNRAQANVLLQQEANLLVTTLDRIHKTQISYTIHLDKNPHATSITIHYENGEAMTLSNSDYVYTLYNTSGDVETLMEPIIKIKQNSGDSLYFNTLPFKLVVQKKGDPELKYELRTILSRRM